MSFGRKLATDPEPFVPDSPAAVPAVFDAVAEPVAVPVRIWHSRACRGMGPAFDRGRDMGKRGRAIAALLGLVPFAASAGGEDGTATVVCEARETIPAIAGGWYYSGRYDVSEATGRLAPRSSNVYGVLYPRSQRDRRDMDAVSPEEPRFAMSDEGDGVVYRLHTGRHPVVAGRPLMTGTLLRVEAFTGDEEVATMKASVEQDEDGEFQGRFRLPGSDRGLQAAFEQAFVFELRDGGRLVESLTFVPGTQFRQDRMQAWRREQDARFANSRYDLRAEGGGRSDKACYRSMGCYLTTAAVGAVGLADDCWELRQLRAFRDRHAARGGAGAALVQEYYRIAPAIVRGIGRRSDSRRAWLATWAFGIVPAATAAWLRCDRVALAIYARMTRRLQQAAAIA